MTIWKAAGTAAAIVFCILFVAAAAVAMFALVVSGHPLWALGIASILIWAAITFALWTV